MNRDGLGVPSSLGVASEAADEALSTRLERLERAYRELLERVQGYERERAEIRRRLERLLDRLGAREVRDP